MRAESFAGRLYQLIRDQSRAIADRCKPHLHLLSVVRPSATFENRFAVAAHTELISSLAELDAFQLQHLIDNIGRQEMPANEQRFCLDHFNAAKAYRVFHDTEKFAKPGTGYDSPWSATFRAVRDSMFVCYINSGAWREAVSCVTEIDNAKRQSKLVDDLIMHLLQAKNFDIGERVVRIFPQKAPHQEEALRAMHDLRALAEIESLLATEEVDCEALTERVSRLALEYGRFYETPPQISGYALIIGHLVKKGERDRAEAIIGAIVEEEVRSELRSYLEV